MAKWILKAVVQKAISLFPAGHRINYLCQKHITKMRLDDAVMDQALVHCAEHVRHAAASGQAVPGAVTLELGTGWYPIVPIGIFLCGAEEVITVDLKPLLRRANLVLTIRKFCEYDRAGRLEQFLSSIDRDRCTGLRLLSERLDSLNLDEILEALRIRYLVTDARHLDLADASVDLIHSNDVFEHIYPPVLMGILKEFKRVAKSGAVMSHFVDMTDHFSHFDNSIDAYHFLRYTDAVWKLIDNSIAPQSRLRVAEYRALYRRAAVPLTDEKPLPSEAADLSDAKLAPRFGLMLASDVAVRHAYLISILT